MSFMCGEQWLETGNPFVEVGMSESQVEWLKAENQRLSKQVESLMSDVHRLDTARQAAVNQCAVMAEFIDSLDCGSVGERGDACTAIDVSNL